MHENYADNSLSRVPFLPEALALGNSGANPVIDCPGGKTVMLPDTGGDSLVLASRAGDSLLMSNRGSISSMSEGVEAIMRSIGAGVASLSVEESKSEHSLTTQPPKSKKQRKLSTSSVALVQRNVRLAAGYISYIHTNIFVHSIYTYT